MHRRHQLLLSKNYEFLVMEMPMDATLDAIKPKKILTWHDFEQLKTLRHQGRRALARYFLAVLPVRGKGGFRALLESLQEANAQHLVDLLVAQAGVDSVNQLLKTPPPGAQEDHAAGSAPGALEPPKTPSDTPLPPGPDPHEYAVRLSRNGKLIREFVDPSSIAPILALNKVISPREADMVLHLHGRNKKWDLILAAVLQRGERAYQAFMAALLQKGYSTMYHTIQGTSTAPSDSEEEPGDLDYDTDDHDTVGDLPGDVSVLRPTPHTENGKMDRAQSPGSGAGARQSAMSQNQDTADKNGLGSDEVAGVAQNDGPESRTAGSRATLSSQNGHGGKGTSDQGAGSFADMNDPKNFDTGNMDEQNHGDGRGSTSNNSIGGGSNGDVPHANNSQANDSPTRKSLSGSPKKAQRRRSSNLKSLQEEDENGLT